MKTENISINVDGHKFKFMPEIEAKHCETCGMGYGTYLNLKQKCRNYVDLHELGYKLIDKYLAAGGDPEMIVMSQKDLANLTRGKK